MSTRMTAQRLASLIAAGDAAEVQQAVLVQPRLLAATVERDGQDGWTPLHLAVAAGHTSIVEVLAAAGADLSALTEDGLSPLHVALEHSPDLVAVLRRLGAPVDAASAAFLGDVPLLTSALDGDARSNDPATGVDLLSRAAAGGAVATVRVLLDRGADPDRGALQAAAAAGAAPVVELLLQAGADVDARDRDTGRTPLHTAVAALTAGPGEDTPAVVTLLLAAGADVEATTYDGASALDIAHVAAARRRARRPDGARAGAQDGALDGALDGAPDPDPVSRLLVAAGASG
jgi:ankyrin repeat protein